MLYALEQGTIEELIVTQCRRDGLPLPARIAGAPQLRTGLELYLTAFVELSTCRPSGFAGPGPIPWTAIREYAVAYRFSARQTSCLESLIRRVDRAYLEYCEKQNGKK